MPLARTRRRHQDIASAMLDDSRDGNATRRGRNADLKALPRRCWMVCDRSSRSGERGLSALDEQTRPGSRRIAPHPPFHCGEAGKPNPMDVSDRNTSQGQERSKPSRSRKTTKTERSGPGNPRRGSTNEAPSKEDATSAESGSRFSWLGASKGRKTSREDVRKGSHAFAGVSSGTNRRTDEVLVDERKAMSGSSPGRETYLRAVERKTPGSTPQGAKDEGGTVKPNERIRSIAIR